MEQEQKKLEVMRTSNDNGQIIEKFVYEHEKAIENYEHEKYFSCMANIGAKNSYLQEILDLFETKFYRFTDGKIHRDDDILEIDNTIGMLTTYTIRVNGNKYTRKVLLKNGATIIVIKFDDGSIANVIAQ